MADNEILKHALKQIAGQVQVLDLKPGDVLVAKLGIADMGEGFPPWLPGPQELESMAEDLQLIVPEGVLVLAHHMGVDFQIVRGLENVEYVRVDSIEGAIPLEST